MYFYIVGCFAVFLNAGYFVHDKGPILCNIGFFELFKPQQASLPAYFKLYPELKAVHSNVLFRELAFIVSSCY